MQENSLEIQNKYKIVEIENDLIIEGITDFNPIHTFECGQCFRWLRQIDGSYNGNAKGKYINISMKEDKVIIRNSNITDFKNIWYQYLDLDTDYADIKRKLRQIDEYMLKAVEFGNGIRILKQELWETVISFIISANNGIPRIMKIIDTLAHEFGEEVYKDMFSFPNVEMLYNRSLEELEICRGGFRCKYIYNTARIVKEGIVDINEIGRMSTLEAKEHLKKLPGVGPKVADCILLFSGTKLDVFPTDVWVKRVMEELYFGREASFKEIEAFADEHFGSLKGYAQQYLFYYARENKIGV